jgi:pimeloyl-ACP methyl ester carboxylesterase
MDIRPFAIEVPQATLDDLHERLARTRWPDAVSGAGWDYGSNLSYMQELIGYWRSAFTWRWQEQIMRSFAHFHATIDGIGIHFIHERGRGPAPMPLILTHGWPGSFLEMLRIIPLLVDPAAHGADPADAFDVVVPSLPGYGFSDRPKQAGVLPSIARLWTRLMTDGLGYRHFAAHGDDIGAGVTTRLGLHFPEHLIGIHITAVADPYLDPETTPLSPAERAFQAMRERWEQEEGAYGHLQGTRPQTLAYGLNDSPAGLAAWIVEKFRAWSDCGGDVERRFSKDQLLANVTLYWVTQTINSSFRLYYDARHHPAPLGPGDRVTVPIAVALTREEVDFTPREWAERTYNVQRWTEFPRGGHFMALEEPTLLVDDLRTFFRPLRSSLTA